MFSKPYFKCSYHKNYNSSVFKCVNSTPPLQVRKIGEEAQVIAVYAIERRNIIIKELPNKLFFRSQDKGPVRIQRKQQYSERDSLKKGNNNIMTLKEQSFRSNAETPKESDIYVTER